MLLIFAEVFDFEEIITIIIIIIVYVKKMQKFSIRHRIIRTLISYIVAIGKGKKDIEIFCITISKIDFQIYIIKQWLAFNSI